MGEIKFDPYTGEPVAPQAPAEQKATDPSPKKGRKGVIIACVAAALVIAGGAFATVKLIGKPGTPYQQIKASAEKALVSDEMTEQLKTAGKITEDGVYGAEGSFDVGGQKVNVDFDTEKGCFSAGISAAGLKGAVYMDDEKITVDTVDLGLDALSYEYASDKEDKVDSYIGSVAGAGNLRIADTVLKMLHSAAGMDKARWEEIEDMVDEKCESLEYEEIDTESVVIHGMIADCGGFSTVVSGEYLADLLDDVSEKMLGKRLTDLSYDLEYYAGDASGALDQLREMEDIEMKFYIDEDEILRQIAVKGKTSGQDLDASLSFAGEDIPWYDTVFKDNNSDFYIAWLAAQDGDEITYDLIVFDYKRFSIEYDKSNLDFTVYTGNGDAFLKGSLENGKDGATVKLNSTTDQSFTGKIVISDECSVDEAPAAKDVLSMSREDFDKLGDVIARLIYGF